MNKNVSLLYKKFRSAGYDPKQALHSAKIVAAFNILESEGLVRMRAEPEKENYMEVYGKSEGYTKANGTHVSTEQAQKELCEILDRDGCWWTCSEIFVDEKWEMVDSCGMHTGYKNPLCPVENCYVVDEMQAAIDRTKSLK